MEFGKLQIEDQPYWPHRIHQYCHRFSRWIAVRVWWKGSFYQTLFYFIIVTIACLGKEWENFVVLFFFFHRVSLDCWCLVQFRLKKYYTIMKFWGCLGRLFSFSPEIFFNLVFLKVLLMNVPINESFPENCFFALFGFVLSRILKLCFSVSIFSSIFFAFFF